MSRINSNVPAVRATYQFQRNSRDLDLALQRLSTGLRINRGADDPAGLIVSERLRNEARGLQQAVSNTIRAKNVLSTAEGALNEVSALLLSVQSLVVRTSNQSGLLDEEVRANQLEIDSLLASIDRIANTTRFGNEPLLNGRKGYILSAIPTTAFGSVAVFASHIPQGGVRTVNVRVTQSAQAAELVFVGAKPGARSTTSATTVQVNGNLGHEVISFISGTSLAQIRDAINAVTALTGVSAVISSPGIATIASALRLSSVEVGADAFVSVTPIGGNFVTYGNGNVERRDAGRNAAVLVDGQTAEVDGLRARVRSGDLDATLSLTRAFGQTLSSASFTVTGGGAIFQITSEIKPGGQARLGFTPVYSTHLGDDVVGLLHTLRSGQLNDLASKRFSQAQRIVDEAVSQVASYRARLGSFQRNLLDTSIQSQTIALENVTAAESVIRDAEIATEVANLTRAQVLVQSTRSILQIANSLPTQVLALLG